MNETSNPTYDFLAYLVVLGHKPTLGKLSQEEFCIGSGNMMGCLHRVMDFVEHRDWSEVRTLIKDRERLNGFLPHGDLRLEAATAALANCILDILRVQNPRKLDKKLETAEKEFMGRLDAEFDKILGKAK